MADHAEADAAEKLHPLAWLSITFSGPFLYVFPPEHRNAMVDVYAPYCPYHEGGFFYSDDSQSETDLWKKAVAVDHSLKDCDRIYSIRGDGIHANPDKVQIISGINPPKPWEAKIFNADPLATTVRTDKALFCLSVPKPRFIHPLYFDFLEIVPGFKNNATGNLVSYPTGLRFFYSWDPCSRIHLVTPAGSIPDITPPEFSQFQTVPDIEVRYEGFNLSDENDPHADSRSCFASLTTLIETELWLNYNDGKSSPTNPSHGKVPQGPIRTTIHTGGDCHAPVITLGLS